MVKYDVVVIGGGFAGCSLVNKLSKLDNSLEISLVERGDLGGKPVSASTFTDVIHDMGIKNSVKKYYNQIEVVSTLGARESHTFDEDICCLIDYKKACEELVKKSSCEVMAGDVKSIKDGKVALKNEKISAKIIVDASGRGYKFRKELSLDIPKIENHLYFRRLIHCNIPDPGSMQLVLGDIGSNGGWFYPISETECEIGVAERTNMLSRADKANISVKQEKNMERFLNHSNYREMVKGSQTESEARVYIPYEPVRNVVKGNVMFLGDNAGMVHPMNGMGLYYIFKVATMCAEHCAKASLGDISMLKGYQNEWNSMLKRDRDIWIHGMSYWSLNIQQLNKIMEIRSNHHIDKMDVLSELKGHTGPGSHGNVFPVPFRLYMAIVKHVLINKLKYKMKYRL